jgi:rhomboid family GlyGly-CTERM serine protease
MKTLANFRIPIWTMLLTAATVALYFANISASTLFFEQNKIVDGELWRLVTGQFMHADGNHLLWNSLGFMVLGSMIELKSKRLLLLSSGTGLLSVSALLLSPFSNIAIYCGLSGALNSLLVVALWIEWKVERRQLYPLIGLLAFAKIVIEMVSEQALFTHITWPPYPASHLAGYLGGLLFIVISNCHQRVLPSGYPGPGLPSLTLWR